MKLKISDDLALPADAITQTFAVLAVRGAGKSNTAAAMAEEMFAAKLPFVVVDPVGAWYGLRSSGDGTAPGLPILILGGRQGDVPLEKGSGAMVADMIVAERLSCVLDVSEFSEGEKIHFLIDFAERLYRTNRDPLHLFLEEADDYCLTPDTEVLTETGWATWDQLRVGASVATFDVETAEYRFEEVQRIITRNHDGPMVGLRTKSLDCLVTPDHRAVLARYQHDPKRRKMYPWSFCAAGQLPRGGFAVPIGGAPVGPGIAESADLLRVMGWVITDGHYHHRRKSEVLCVCQSVTTTKLGQSIAATMHALLLKFDGVRRYDRPARKTRGIRGETLSAAPSMSWYLGKELSARLMAYLRPSGIHRIPRPVLQLANREQLETLYLGLLEGDGTAQRPGRWTAFYAGDNEGLADDFQEIALRLGISTVKTRVPHSGYRDQWYVHIASRQHHWVRRPTAEHYTGMVWDITVSSGAFVARRNGRIFVTGNCPQRPMREQARLLRAFENIVRRGRARGLGITMITQRSAAINKNVLTQIETLIVLRTTSPQDRKAIAAWVEYHGQAEELLESLPSLESGEAWVWSPSWLGIMERVRIRRRWTFDSGATPKNLKGTRPPATLADVDLASVKERMAATIERAKAEDPRELRRRIAELEREIRRKPAPAAAPAIDQAAIDRAIGRAVKDAVAPREKQLVQLRTILAKANAILGTEAAPILAVEPMSVSAIREYAHRTLDREKRRPRVITSPSPNVSGGERLAAGERKILTALAQYPDGRTKNQAALLAGYAHNGGGFNNYLSALRSKGWIEGHGDRLVITDAGATALGSWTPLPMGEELQSYWLGKVSKAERAALEVLLQAYPRALTKEEVAAGAGYEASGGGFNNALSRLRTLELITRGKDMKASDDFFE